MYLSWWVWTHAYFYDITITKVLNIPITSYYFLLFFGSFIVAIVVCFLVRTFNMKSTLLTYFKAYNSNTVLVTIGTVLYSRSLKFIHFCTMETIYPLKNNSPFPLLPIPWQPPFCSFFYESDYISYPLKKESCSICPHVKGVAQGWTWLKWLSKQASWLLHLA